MRPFEDIEVVGLGQACVDYLGRVFSYPCEDGKKARGLTVVLDAGTMRDGSLELASQIDVLIASARFAAPLAGEDSPAEKALESLSRVGPKEIVITLGSEGSVGWNRGEIIEQSAFPVEVVDTTGAGDVYHGAYLYGLLQGWDMKKCMRFASATSALKCRAIGARAGIPTLEEVTRFLEANPRI